MTPVGGQPDPAQALPSPGFADVLAPRPVLDSEAVFEGAIWDVARDHIDLGDGVHVHREYVRHTGAVAIVALDERDRVLFVRQYRHPTGYELYEIPAGLLDVSGEPPVDCAKRELAEEADLVADRWDVLIDWFNSPGGSDEAIRVFLARDLSEVPLDQRHQREHEEAQMTSTWASLDEAHDAVLGGRIHSPSAVVGILAAHAARARGWATLRPADAPWPEHKAWRSERKDT